MEVENLDVYQKNHLDQMQYTRTRKDDKWKAGWLSDVTSGGCLGLDARQGKRLLRVKDKTWESLEKWHRLVWFLSF